MMNTQLTSSVALCSYNGEKYIQEQLESLASQTRLPDELVVCDDCSTDRTAEIVQAFAKTAPFPVRFFQNEHNLKPILNFSKAASLCTGDIIYFCDQDDTWDKDKIKDYMDVFEARPEVGMVVSDSAERSTTLAKIFIKLRKINRHFGRLINTDNLKPLANRYEIWFGHTIAYRSKYNEMLIPYPELIGHDTWVFTIMYSISQCVYFDKCYTTHRVHDSSVMSQNYFLENTSEYKQIISETSTLRFIYWSMGEQAKFIADFLSQTGIKYSNNPKKTQQIIDAFNSRFRHYNRRGIIRSGGIIKYYYILTELLFGGYFRHSSGILSFGKDLLGR